MLRPSPVKKEVSVKWGHLIDDTEGVVKASFDRYNNRINREKSEDIMVNDISISESKVYISIVSSNYNLIYKGEADFYLEDKQKKLHKIPGKDVDKESVALHLEKGKTAEIGVDFPDSCQPGDYLLKIRVYNENEECYYTIRQWFEAYTSHQVSSRDKPIPIGPVRSSDYKVLSDEDDIFDVVRNMPEFPGGMGACLKFLMANTEYPEKAKAQKVEGKVSVKFVVEKDGSISNPQIIKGGNPLLNDEALRVVNSMPKWKPGKQRGKVVRVGYTVPIIFKLQ